MSRAFVGEGYGAEPPPERAVSPLPNLVTPRGLETLAARQRARHRAGGATDKVCLGMQVTLATPTGARVSFRLVREDAAARAGAPRA